MQCMIVRLVQQLNGFANLSPNANADWRYMTHDKVGEHDTKVREQHLPGGFKLPGI